jgi:hypothetical protein
VRRLAAIGLLALILAPSPTSSRTWYVTPDGTGDAPTIQAGIDSAAAGDVVELADGQFAGDGNRDIAFGGKEIVVRSASGNATACVIRCDGTVSEPHRGVLFTGQEGPGSTLRDVTITDGVAVNGGAIYCRDSSALILGCRIVGNTASDPDSGWGGAVFCAGTASLRITSCIIAQNSATEGGGLMIGPYATPVIESCEVMNNTAVNRGGGLWAYTSAPTIQTCMFAENHAGNGGGLAFQGHSDSPAAILNCTISANTAEEGGGLYAWVSNLLIEDCHIVANTAVFSGGGLEVNASSAVVSTSAIFENSVSSGSGGGLICSNSSPLVTDCEFMGNTAAGGGGLFFSEDSSPSLLRTIVSANQAGPVGGGGLFCAGGEPIITSCTFDANSNPDGRGGGLHFRNSSIATLENTIVAFSPDAQALMCWDEFSSVNLLCCDLYGNAGGDWVGCVSDLAGVNGNLSADPLFCDLDTGDHNIRSDSPCAPENSGGCGLVGALPVGCGPVSLEQESWGKIKERYRIGRPVK